MAAYCLAFLVNQKHSSCCWVWGCGCLCRSFWLHKTEVRSDR